MATKKKRAVVSKVKKEPHFRMIDIGNKRTTARRAVAMGTISVGREAFGLIKNGQLPKGNVLALAEAAGIMAAKKTADIIPLCHPLPLDQVTIHPVLEKDGKSITVYCQAAAIAKTGVEMEALAGVNAALLTIYDLVKGVEPALEIYAVRLLVKEGGKSGLWLHPDGVPAFLTEQFLLNKKSLAGMKAAILVMSDSAAKNLTEDKSGPLLWAALENAGASVKSIGLIPDDRPQIVETLTDICKKSNPDVIITSGGTGLSKRDVTPEALQEVCDRLIPGFGELLRQDGAHFTAMSWLSRSVAGLIGPTLVIALPGSPKAVKEGIEALLPLLPHALAVIHGHNHRAEGKKKHD